MSQKTNLCLYDLSRLSVLDLIRSSFRYSSKNSTNLFSKREDEYQSPAKRPPRTHTSAKLVINTVEAFSAVIQSMSYLYSVNNRLLSDS